MIEIRTIQKSEAPDFLRLLCEVFSLDFQRASSVFFAEPLYDLNRKWAAFEDGVMQSILTTTALEFGWGAAIGIAGVATRPERAGQGIGTQLLERVLQASENRGEGPALLFAHRESLYTRVGFETLDRVLRGSVAAEPEMTELGEMSTIEIHERYREWAEGSPNRMRRNDARWRFWSWGLRVCDRVGDGYLCLEGTTVREAVGQMPTDVWPVPKGTEWIGLSSLTEKIGVPLLASNADLYFMGRGFTEVPEMFLTDQF